MKNDARKSKSIRILTFHSAYSFGAVLQTYALYKFLNTLFSDVKVLNFRPDIFSLNFELKKPLSWIRCLQFNFRNKYIKHTNKITAKDLRKKQQPGIVYVIGSDQVWNPNITQDFQDIYYGDFIPSSSKKVSYAASFGVTEFSNEQKRNIKSLIHDFSAISVREFQGVEICRQLLDINAVEVLDPTFLLDSYDDITGKKSEKDELGLFILDNNSDECFIAGEKIARQLNLKPKIINKNRPVKGFKIIPLPTIPKFLKEIKRSKFIITNSFHGLCFSLIFNRQFAFVVTNEKKMSRAKSLLDKLNLSERLFIGYDDLLGSEIWNKDIDYKQINCELEKLRMDSRMFLINALAD